MIFTSFYRKFGNTPEGRQNRDFVHQQKFQLISISVTKPSWCQRTCKTLAPSWSLFVDYQHREIDDREYLRRFKQQLACISAERIAAAAQKLNNSVLLCWEPSEQFCHRHIVAAWLRYNGVECYELERVTDIVEFK